MELYVCWAWEPSGRTLHRQDLSTNKQKVVFIFRIIVITVQGQAASNSPMSRQGIKRTQFRSRENGASNEACGNKWMAPRSEKAQWNTNQELCRSHRNFTICSIRREGKRVKRGGGGGRAKWRQMAGDSNANRRARGP